MLSMFSVHHGMCSVCRASVNHSKHIHIAPYVMSESIRVVHVWLS